VTFEVEAAGARRTIDVQRGGEGWAITVDGRAMSASVSQIGARWSLLYRSADSTAAPHSYEAVLEPRHRGDQLVRINGRAVRVSFVEHSRRSGMGPGSSSGASGSTDVIAPMPGRIVKVLVKAGDRVAGGQGLVVVEAMKMENELRAPREGTVAAVRVSEGMSVDAGAVLVVVE
jgi:biotin carboxyl carrier protein